MHIAPELRQSSYGNFSATQEGDMFALGCVMNEILYRQPLVSDASNTAAVQPNLTWSSTDNQLYMSLVDTFIACVAENPVERPLLKAVKRAVDACSVKVFVA